MWTTDTRQPAPPAAVPGGGDRGSDLSFEAELRPLIIPALRLAAAMRLDRQDAEDAVQEAALRAWRRQDNRREGTDLRPWFLAIVANQCRETRRSRWASVLRSADPPHPPVPGADPIAALDVTAALRRLPETIRLAVVLRYYLDLPFEEVASVSGCSLDAAKSRVRRGVQSLGAALRLHEALP
ncbi:MAG TPA: RNA polymerase sigma factor [Candidatus Angelobacter sp.]|nr:RNA polymerase sigma factor [Candidatus Angelobacter sp.]